MTKPREQTREELQAEIEDGKKKIRQFENREKMLRQKLSKEERRTRSHRLIVRDTGSKRISLRVFAIRATSTRCADWYPF